MKRVFKTRYFTRWMRKTGLSDDALCAAVAEMAHGLVDADLGEGFSKNELEFLGAVSAQGPEHWWQATGRVVGFLSLGLKKMTVPTSRMRN